MEKAKLEKLFVDRRFSEFKWIKAKDIVVAQWVRFRCNQDVRFKKYNCHYAVMVL
jgi:hypothetical protein